MPRRKKDPEPAEETRSPETPASEAVEPRAVPFEEKTADKSKRFNFGIRDGKVVLERGATRDALREFVEGVKADPEAAKLAGLSEGAETVKVEPELVGFVLDTETALSSAAAAKRFGLTAEETVPFFAYKGEHREQLCDRGAALANKYIPSAWLQKSELVVFGGMILAARIQSFKAAAAFAEEKKKAKQAEKAPDVKQAEKVEQAIGVEGLAPLEGTLA